MLQYRNRKLALAATASFFALLTATPALANCDPTPITEPIGNITTDGTQVVCTLVNTGQTILGNANQVRVDVANGGTLDNSQLTINGNGSTLFFAGGSSSDNLHVNITGNDTTLFVSGGAVVTHFNASLSGSNIGVEFDTGSNVSIAPGTFFITSGGGAGLGGIVVNGTVNSTGPNGNQYLLTSGTGQQVFSINGTLNVQSDGLAIDTGDGDDAIFLGAGAVISGGIGNNIVFNGGTGADVLNIAGTGISNYSSVNIERLVVVAGAGGSRVLNGTGDYSNIQLVSGTTTVSSNAALGQSNSAIQLNATARLNLLFGGATSFGHTITGLGTIEQGGQTVTYTGNGSGFAGNFVLGSGTAILGSSNAFGSAAITNGGALEFGSFTVANQISGTGTVTKTGAGVGILSGANSYSGGTFVNMGTLSITGGGAVGTGAVTIASGAVFELDFATDTSFANDILGQGAVSKTGAGVVTLTGNNSYSGGTSISGGGIRVDDLARLGTGPVVVHAPAFLALDYNGVAPLVLGTSFLSGDGGFIKEGSGEVEIDAANNFIGGTLIRGGTLRLADDDGLGQGTIRIDAGATLALGNAGFSPSVNNNLVGSGTVLIDTVGGAALYGYNSSFTGAINLTGAGSYIYAHQGEALGSGSVNLIGAGSLIDFDDSSDTVIAASLTGMGTFEKRGAHVVTLTGTGSLTGNVNVVAGTLRISGDVNIGTATVDIAGGAFLDVNTNGSTTLANALTGQGKLQKSGTGTVLVTGTNSHSGGTDIFAGAIRVTDLSALGSGPISVYNGAALDLSIAGSATLNLTASGAGRLRKSNSGDLTLTGNSLSGGLDITGGRVILHDVSSLGSGPVTTAADTQIVFDLNGPHLSNTVISGAGALTKEGSGLLVINNANSFTGGTVINAGRIGLNDGGALGSGTILVQLNAILGIGDITLANNVTGGGQIIKTAGGNAVLTGTNTHSGGIDIQGGSVSVTGNAPLGTGTVTIGSGAQLIYTNAGAASFTNALSGAGTFTKQGAGTLTFANNFAVGALNVTAGKVRINGIATTSATVASGASLDGTGRIVGNLTNNGIVAPGNSIGILTVQGNYVHNSGSVLEIEFDGSGGIDKLDVTGAATLNGGTLRFISIGGAEGAGGTFLTATGGVTGTFATVETVGAQLPLAVIYQPNSATMAPSVLTARPSTVNAQSFAVADTALGFVDTVTDAPRIGSGSRLWLQGFGADGKRSASGTTLSYGHRSAGFSGGLTIGLGERWSAGAAVGWARGDITLGSGGGGGDQDSLLGGVQLRYAHQGTELALGAIIGRVDQDMVRNVSFNNFSASVTSGTKSSVMGGYVSADVRLARSGGWDLGLGGRASVTVQDQDGFTESGTSPLRLTLPDIQTTTVEGRAGFSAARSFESGLGVRADLGVRWLGAMGDRRIPVTFAASNAGVTLQGDTRDAVQGYGAIRFDYGLSDSVTLSAGYAGQLGTSDRHEGRIGLSFGF